MRPLHAVGEKRSEVTGHLLRKLLGVCSLFLRRGGVLSCTVTGGPRNSGDLHSGKANLSDQANRSWA